MTPPTKDMQKLMHEQALLLERLQLELSGHIRDMVRPIGDFYAYVTNPTTGCIVRLQGLEKEVQHLDATLQTLLPQELEARLRRVETNLSKAEEKRRWVARDLVGMGIMLIIASIVSAAVTVYFLGA